MGSFAEDTWADDDDTKTVVKLVTGSGADRADALRDKQRFYCAPRQRDTCFYCIDGYCCTFNGSD